MIIALGESIVITGATTAELDLDTGRAVAFAVAFLGSAALWWLYFNYVATIAERRLEMAAEDRTLVARDAYTYLHVVMIAGVIVSAVGRRAGDRPPRGAPARRRAGGGGGGPGHLPHGPRAVPPADDRTPSASRA